MTTMDWGEKSVELDKIAEIVCDKDLTSSSEAETRFQIIDTMIIEVLGWSRKQINVEERITAEEDGGYVDYLMRNKDQMILVEAKRYGITFATATNRTRLSLSGTVLTRKGIKQAIEQAEQYAETLSGIDAIVVTNGLCWCIFGPNSRDSNVFAYIFFPFEKSEHAEKLFELIGEQNVASGSLGLLSENPQSQENRLIYELGRLDGRVDRNNIADHLVPAINKALYADAILKDPQQLERCFVPTEARTRFDSLLNMHLADVKPKELTPVKRIRSGKTKTELHDLVESGLPQIAPPVTLIIGPVGSGKSTYLSHFKHVSGSRILRDSEAHWVYVDFEEMGPSGNCREFLYKKLLDYLGEDHEGLRTDYRAAVEPAYKNDISRLAKGPLAPIIRNKEAFDKKISEYIMSDYEKVEPYVDKVFAYIAEKNLTIIVLDNTDLYEDEKIEADVFSEGLAFSKRVKAHVIVSMRDTTFVKHKSESIFDAYELRKLWLDPPPFSEVLSRRLKYSRVLLDQKEARISTSGGSHIVVEDLGVFFDIVKESLLSGTSGYFLNSISDLNIRRGLNLVNNFLTSGHIQADRALKIYLEDGDRRFKFPFHEVFKGTLLGQWRHFREDRSDLLNLFDSRIGSSNLRLLRLHILKFLYNRANRKETIETPFGLVYSEFCPAGLSPENVDLIIERLQKEGLIKVLSHDLPKNEQILVITRCGGYYIEFLSKRLVYVEECMYDTSIDDTKVWGALSELTNEIEHEHDVPKRMKTRKERMEVFLEYLISVESNWAKLHPNTDLIMVESIKEKVLAETDHAVSQSERWYS